MDSRDVPQAPQSPAQSIQPQARTPFLYPPVCTAFLNEYLNIRQVKWNSTLGWLESWYKDNASEKTGDSVAMNREFYLADNANTLHAWTQLLSELGKVGRKQSLLSGTYHAIRSYIIKKLMASEFSIPFTKYIEELKTATDQLHQQIKLLISASGKREDVQNLTTKYQTNVMYLCDLGDSDYICEAAMQKLFGDLQYPDRHNVSLPYLNSINENIPFFYHPNYYLIHFELFYRSQKHLQMSFDEFEAKHIKGGIADIVNPNMNTSSYSVTSAFGSMFSSVGSMIKSPSTSLIENIPPNNGPNGAL